MSRKIRKKLLISLPVNHVEYVFCQENLSVQSRFAFTFFLGSSIEFRWLSNFVLEFFILGQKSCQLFLLFSKLMFPIEQVSLESILFQFKDVPDLLNFLVLDGFHFNSNLFSSLDSFPSGNIGIMQDINITNSFRLQISLDLLAPFSKEFVSCLQYFIGLLLAFEVLSH